MSSGGMEQTGSRPPLCFESLVASFWHGIIGAIGIAPAVPRRPSPRAISLAVYRRAYRNLIYFHEVDKGGHFAAWEQPELFAIELRAAFKSSRQFD